MKTLKQKIYYWLLRRLLKPCKKDRDYCIREIEKINRKLKK